MVQILPVESKNFLDGDGFTMPRKTSATLYEDGYKQKRKTTVQEYDVLNSFIVSTVELDLDQDAIDL